MLEELKAEYKTITYENKLAWLYGKDDELSKMWEYDDSLEIVEATERVFQEILKLK